VGAWANVAFGRVDVDISQDFKAILDGFEDKDGIKGIQWLDRCSSRQRFWMW